MSKYKLLWEYIKKDNSNELKLTFIDIEKTLGFPIDHSFLNYKKELIDYGYKVERISLKKNIYIF
jgi:hypothetical protein